MKTVLINMLSRKAGRNVSTPHGCEWLCHDIAACTKESISVNTLKRLTGVLKDYNDGKIHLRGANKDILARYLGYKEWSDFCTEVGSWESVKSDEPTKSGTSFHSAKSNARVKTKDSGEPRIVVGPCKSEVIKCMQDNVDKMDKKFLGQSA